MEHLRRRAGANERRSFALPERRYRIYPKLGVASCGQLRRALEASEPT